MTNKFDSIAEREAAPTIASLGGKPCTTFTPLASRFYIDASGEEHEAKPDFIIERPRCTTFIETKFGTLNNHYSRSSSQRALEEAYEDYFGRYSGDLTYSEISRALYNTGKGSRGYVAVAENGFNHSCWKQVAVQAKHGWQKFLVVFKRKPSKRHAKRYLDAGLVFCTLETLPDMLQVIELCQFGIFIPFYFKGPGYSFTVTPDHTSRGLPPEAIEATDRTKFLAAVSAAKEAEITFTF